MENARDLLTDEEFVKRRNNQRFASRQNQIRYNNIKAQEKRNIKSYVDRPLDKNRTILQKLLEGKTEVTKSKDFLLGAGFNFNYFSFVKNLVGSEYTGIYEFGIAKQQNDQYHIIRL